MRGLAWVAVAALVAATAGAALAQPRGDRAPEAVRRAVTVELQGVRSDFMEPGDPRLRQPPNPDRLLSREDANGDRWPDWQVQFERSEWPGGWCGSGGCRRQLWIGGPSGPVLALDETVGDIRFAGEGTARTMTVSVHGTACGGAGADPCRYGYRWNSAQQRFGPPRNANTGRLYQGGLSLLPIEPAVGRVAEARRALSCEGEGGQASVAEVDDLNGDHRNDWVVWAGYPCPNVGETVVLVSDGDGSRSWREAWRGRAETFWVDPRSRPAGLAIVEACGDTARRCPERRLLWSDRMRQFAPEG